MSAVPVMVLTKAKHDVIAGFVDRKELLDNPSPIRRKGDRITGTWLTRSNIAGPVDVPVLLR